MAAIPIIRGGLQALYPVTVTYRFSTNIMKNENGSEDRNIRDFGRVKFDLTWGALIQSEKNTLKSFADAAKGRDDASSTLTFRGTTYTNLGLDSDTFSAVENTTTQYDVKMTFSQAITQDLSPGTPGQPFPTFANGSISQLPWTQRKGFRTDLSATSYGPRFPWAWYGAGLTDFPDDGLMGWNVGGQTVSDADIAVLVAHFIANAGMYGDFTYPDEDGTPHTKVRYDSDELVVTYQEPNRASVSIGLQETF